MSISSIIEGLSVLEKIRCDLLLIELAGNEQHNLSNVRKTQNAVKKVLTYLAFDIKNRINGYKRDENLYETDNKKVMAEMMSVKNLINHNDFEIIESFLNNYGSLICRTNFTEKNNSINDLNSLVFSIISERFG